MLKSAPSMYFNRSILAIAGCALCAVGGASACTRIDLGERLYETCRADDPIDDDGDDRLNCDDPDCHVFEACRRVRDAGRSADDDAGEDAGGRLATCSRCRVDEVCVDDTCQAVGALTAGLYELRIFGISVPAADLSGRCYDLCATISESCPCPPDPYIDTFVHRVDGSERQLSTTLPATDALAAAFVDFTVVMALEVGDALVLRVFDHDEPDGDDLMFECKPDLRRIESTEHPCAAADPASLLGPDAHVRIALRQL